MFESTTLSPSSHKLSLKYKLQLILLIRNKLEVLDQHIWRTGGKNTAPLRIDSYNNNYWAVQTTFILKVWKFVMRKYYTGIMCLYNICMCTLINILLNEDILLNVIFVENNNCLTLVKYSSVNRFFFTSQSKTEWQWIKIIQLASMSKRGLEPRFLYS